MPEQQIRCARPCSKAFENCRLDRPAVPAVGRMGEYKAGHAALAEVRDDGAVNFLFRSHRAIACSNSAAGAFKLESSAVASSEAVQAADIASPFTLPRSARCWLMSFRLVPRLAGVITREF